MCIFLKIVDWFEKIFGAADACFFFDLSVKASFRVPSRKSGLRITFSLGSQCIDSLGKQSERALVGVYQCHGAGGNQVNVEHFLFGVPETTVRNYTVQRSGIRMQG